MHWPAIPLDEIQARVRSALAGNTSFDADTMLGFPASVLDSRVFPPEPTMMSHAWLTVLQSNPNHIGCHTTGASEHAFGGTHELERDLLRICAEEILNAEPEGWDGYVASGGTESNLQAMWTHRNELRDGHGVDVSKMAILCSEDTHYSIDKAADVLGLRLVSLPVGEWDRAIDPQAVHAAAAQLVADGVKAVLVVLNLGTTMFGSVDDPEVVLPVLLEAGLTLRVHVDGAFGGFLFPFTAPDNRLSFADPRIDSFTLDGHKMLQAPYGTGIHLIRAGRIQYATTPGATYVPGADCTLIGSRSGSNAVAVWMILMAHGSDGGRALCQQLCDRTTHLHSALTQLGVRTYRRADMNIVAVRIEDLPNRVMDKHMLVPDRHDDTATWAKIIVMPHVTDAHIDTLCEDIASR